MSSAWRPHRSRAVRALPWLFLLPALAAELLVHLVPMAVGVLMSVYRVTVYEIRNWTSAPGPTLANYRLAVDFQAPIGAALLRSFTLTLAFTVLVVGLSWLTGLVAAVLLHPAFRGRSLLRTVFLVPYALPVYASVITWSFMLQRDTGAVNALLVDALGLTGSRPFWLIGPNAFWSLVVVDLWRTWPFALLTFTAGLQTVPEELYEAAALDGAGLLRQLRSVTLPVLAPVNRVLLIVLFLWTFNDFTTPYTLFGHSAPPSADLVAIHIYQASFITWNFGLGSAMSVLLLAFLAVAVGLPLLAGRMLRRAGRGTGAG
ncbi:carbohydrate ABC transporter permease [Peterkaempfera griseoplana]|uniref:carbohydrate ABC transporter permease n=1 Tax=Peterkaempfera griseoplana TaxID=66896 RepID=UPI0007C64452|nr:sugar ABC transporter permease [Peterkaempfera griseoplana]